MRRVIVKCLEKKPAKVCELIKNENGEVFMEIKYPGTGVISINLSDYLQQLGA